MSFRDIGNMVQLEGKQQDHNNHNIQNGNNTGNNISGPNAASPFTGASAVISGNTVNGLQLPQSSVAKIGPFGSSSAGGNCDIKSSVAKIGPFGSSSAGGNCDIKVAPLLLKSITIRHGCIVDALAFTYKDCHGVEQTTGQWGGNGGRATTITLGPNEFVREVHGMYGQYIYGGDGIANFTIVTNLQTYGPYGGSKNLTNTKSFHIPVKNNGSIVGFFAHRNNVYVTAIGVYVKPF